MAAETERNTIIFTYGTLKRGFSNHNLIQDVINSNDASFLGTARTFDCLPLVCGPYRVPFLLNFPGRGDQVRGEIYSVSARAIARMDELEGTRLGHYERLPLKIVRDNDGIVVDGEAYFAHRSYANEMWKVNVEKGGGYFGIYSEKEAKGYVRRVDRPKGVPFLHHIRVFVGAES